MLMEKEGLASVPEEEGEEGKDGSKEREEMRKNGSASQSRSSSPLPPLSFPMCTVVLQSNGAEAEDPVVLRGGFPPDVLVHLLNRGQARSFPGEKQGSLVFGSLQGNGDVFLGGVRLDLLSARVLSGHVVYDAATTRAATSYTAREDTFPSSSNLQATGKQTKKKKQSSTSSKGGNGQKSSTLGWIGG